MQMDFPYKDQHTSFLCPRGLLHSRGIINGSRLWIYASIGGLEAGLLHRQCAPAALQASAQLHVVRESHSATSRELEEARAEVRQLKAAVAELAEQVDGAREAHALALQEFDVRPHCRKAPHIA